MSKKNRKSWLLASSAMIAMLATAPDALATCTLSGAPLGSGTATNPTLVICDTIGFDSVNANFVTVTINPTASISSSSGPAISLNNNGRIINSGILTSSGATGAGVISVLFRGANGYVSNSGTIQATTNASYAGGLFGVAARGVNGSINNLGTISTIHTGLGASFGTSGININLTNNVGATVSSSITNTASRETSRGSYGSGVNINNSGLIGATNAGLGASFGVSGRGVRVTNNANAMIYSSITNAVSTAASGGFISTQSYNSPLFAAIGNSGIISATNAGLGVTYGVRTLYGGLTNYVGANVSARITNTASTERSFGFLGNGSGITNSGAISSTNDGLGASFGINGTATNLRNNAGATVHSSITNAASRGNNFGFSGGSALITNRGTISASSSGLGESYGIAGPGSNIANYAGATISGSVTNGTSQRRGFGISSGGVTISNSGTIRGTSTGQRGAYGIFGYSGAAITNNASGLIEGDTFGRGRGFGIGILGLGAANIVHNITNAGTIRGDGAAIIDVNANAAFLHRTNVTNSGSLVGDVRLGFGDDSVTLQHGTIFDLTVAGSAATADGGAGSNSFTLQNALGEADATAANISNFNVSGSGSGRWTLSGIISDGAGAHSVTQIGSGVLILSGINIYTGGTTISGGTLQGEIFATGSSFGTGNISNNATLQINAADGVVGTLDQGISGTGTVTKTGNGTLILSGANTYTGRTTISAGTLRANNNSAFGAAAGVVSLNGGILGLGLADGDTVAADGDDITLSNAITLNADGTINVADAVDVGTLTGIIGQDATGNRSLAKTGAGTLILSGANSYTAGTTISAGTLRANNDAALGMGDVSLNGGILGLGVADGNGDIITLNNDIGLINGGSVNVADADDVGTLSGNISGTTFPLNKTGAGTLILSGDNTHSDQTNINAGTLRANSNSAFGTSNVRLNGGILGLGLSDGDVIGADGENITFSNAITLNANGTINVADAADVGTLTGNIGQDAIGNRSLTKTGDGTLILSGDNSYSGGTTISGGTLRANSNNALGGATGGIVSFNGGTLGLGLADGDTVAVDGENITLSNTVTLNGNSIVNVADAVDVGTLSGDIGEDATGNRSLTKTGDGTLILSGNNAYTGGTNINEGRLIADHDNALGTGAVTNNAELEIELGRHLGSGVALDSYNQSVTGSLLFNVASGGDNIAIFNLINGATFGAGGALNVSFAGNDAAAYGIGTSWVLASSTSDFLDALALTRSFSFNGVDNIRRLNGLFLRLASEDLGASGRYNLVLSLTDQRLVRNIDQDNTAVVLNNGLQDEDFLLTGNDRNADGVDPNADTHNLSVSGGNNAVIDGIIRGTNANAGLTKLGTGTLTLSGNNTYGGGTFIRGGTLVAGHNNAFGDVGGDVTYAGQDTNIGLLNGINVANNIVGGSALGRYGWIVDGAANTATLSGVISGDGIWSKSGTGTLILTRNNTYNGGTTINDGTLQGEVFAGGGSSFGAGNITNNAALRINAGNGVNGVFGQAISGTGSVTMSGSGNLTLSAVNSYQGGTFLNGGRLNISRDDQLGDATGRLTFNGGSLRATASLTSNRDVTLEQDGSFSILPQRNVIWNGAIDGAGQLIKDGSGDLSLTNGGNSYRGGVRINQGRLSVFADGNLGDAGNRVTLSGGTFRSSVNIASNRQGTLEGIGSFLVTPNRNATWNGVIDGAGQLLKLGTGTLTLTNSNTYRGGTRLMTGVVAVSRDDSLGDASGLVSFANGTLRAIGSFASNRHATIDGFGTFSVDGGQTLTWDGVIDGAGLLNKDGLGTLTLTNNNNLYQRPTRISAGTLRLGNVGASNVLPDNGAVNLGSGTSASILDVARARETIGALNVGPNGTVRVELVPDDTDSLSGRLNVTGNAAFAVGARLNIVPGQGGYLAGQSYNVLEAGSINTNGGDIIGGAISPFVNFQTQLVDGATDRLVVNVVGNGNVPPPTLYASVAQTSQQASIGAAIGGLAEEAQPSLNTASAPVATSSPSGTTSATPSTSATSSSAASAPSRTTTPSGSNNPALSARQADAQLVVGNINTLSTPEVRLAYDQIGGSSHYGVTQLQHQADNAFADLLQSRLNQVSNNDAVSYRGSNLAVSGEDFQPGEVTQEGWVKRYGYAEDADGSFNATGLKYQTQGEAYGADFRLSEHWQMGFAAGRNKLDGSDQEDSASIESYQSAIYGKYSGNDGLYLQGAAGLTRQDVETHRSIQFGQLSRQANSDRTDYTALANLEIGKAFSFNWGRLNSPTLVAAPPTPLAWGPQSVALTLTPHLGMNYSHQFLSNFREEDAGTLDLNIKRADQDRLQIVPGISAQLQVKGQGYSLTPYIDLSYAYGLVNSGGKIEGQLGQSRFAIDGESEDPSYGLIRAGLAMDWEEGLLGLNTNLYLDYNGKAGQSETDHALTTGFGISW